MFGLFKRSKPTLEQLLQQLDPGDQVRGWHDCFLELQVFSLMMPHAPLTRNNKLSPEVFIQLLLFSRGAIDYLVEHNFPQDDEEGLLSLWTFLQQIRIAEKFGDYCQIDDRADLVKRSLEDVAPGSTGHKIAACGYRAAHESHKALKSGKTGNVAFALADALAEHATG